MLMTGKVGAQGGMVGTKARQGGHPRGIGGRQRGWTLRDFEIPTDQQSASSFRGGGRSASSPRDHRQGYPVSPVSPRLICFL